MRPGDDVASAGGCSAAWDVDRAGDRNRTAARVRGAIQDAEGFAAAAAHAGATALKRPDADDAPWFSRNLARAYVVKGICRVAAAEAGATAADVRALVLEVQRRVADSSGVTLRPELHFVGFGDEGEPA